MKQQHNRRTACPISFALETVGDRWSLLIMRARTDFEKKTDGAFFAADEGMVTHMLAGRLAQLVQVGWRKGRMLRIAQCG